MWIGGRKNSREEFLDEKNKTKVRFAALLQILETEQDSFYSEYSVQVSSVLIDTFSSQVDKIREKKLASGAKEFSTLSKCSLLLKKVISTSSTCNKDIVAAAHILLASNNHHKLRLEGFSLLLTFINNLEKDITLIKDDDLETIYDGAISLYSNSINLFVFESFFLPKPHDISQNEVLLDQSASSQFPKIINGGKVKLNKSLIPGGRVIHQIGNTDKSPLMIAAGDRQVEDSLELIQTVFDNIIESCLMVKSTKSAVFMKNALFQWDLFIKCYLRFLFPMTCYRLSIPIKEGDGFPTCPPKILQLLVEFFVKNLLKQNSKDEVITSILFQSFESQELIHEILRQALLLPFSESECIKSAIHLIRSWILNVFYTNLD